MTKEKRQVTCMVMIDDQVHREKVELRTVYQRADGSEYVRVMGRRLPVVENIYVWRYHTITKDFTGALV